MKDGPASSDASEGSSTVTVEAWKGHGGAVLSMDVLPGRERSILATGGDDGTVRLWDTRTGRAIRCYRGMFTEEAVTAVAFLDDRRLFCGCGTSLVELEVVGQRIIVTEAVDTVSAITTEEINQISVHPKSRRYLALADDSGCVTILDVSMRPTKKIKQLRRAEDDFCTCVAFRPKVNWDLAAGYQQCTLGLWDFSRARQRVVDVTSSADSPPEEEEDKSRLFNPPYVASLSFSEDGRHVAAALGDGTVVVYDYSSGKRVACLKDGHAAAVGAVHFVPGGSGLIVSGANDRTACLWRFASSGPKQEKQAEVRLLCRVTDLPGKPNWITSTLGSTPEMCGRVFIASTSSLVTVINVPRDLEAWAIPAED